MELNTKNCVESYNYKFIAQFLDLVGMKPYPIFKTICFLLWDIWKKTIPNVIVTIRLAIIPGKTRNDFNKGTSYLK